MRKPYFLFTFLLIMLFSNLLIGQRFYSIPSSEDPTQPTDILPIIQGDTTATGERVDSNTVYKLENGKVYYVSGRILATADWALQIESEDVTDTENKAILIRVPNASGEYSLLITTRGHMTLRNLWIVSGQKGPLEDFDWGRIRLLGNNKRTIIKDCIIEKDNGGFIQVRGDFTKIYLENSIFRNGGNRGVIQGNGRGIDVRDNPVDSLVVKNCIFHNIIDRVLRSRGVPQPHNYIEFDHNTIFNQVGRNGCLTLEKVIEAKVTNNFFMNPIMLGTTPVYAATQTHPDNESHFVIAVDTLYEDTKLTMASNNFFWTQDVLDYYDSNDSVSVPGIYNSLIVQSLEDNGVDVDTTYFQEDTPLNSVPRSILQYVIDLYNDPTSENMFDHVVEDSLVAGTALDNGNLFDFSKFDPCFSSTAISATASTTGEAIGATYFCPNLVSDVFTPELAEHAISVFPNPVYGTATFSYTLRRSSHIVLSLYNTVGQQVQVLSSGHHLAGEHSVTVQLSTEFAKGMYIARLQTEEGEQSLKLLIE